MANFNEDHTIQCDGQTDGHGPVATVAYAALSIRTRRAAEI